MSRSKSRSPIPPSRPFLPPSHYAAAAGLTYPVDPRPDSRPSFRRQSLSVPISYPSQNLSSELPDAFDITPNPGANSTSLKRQSNLGSLPLLEAHLLPSLKDTIDRMTKPPMSLPDPSSSTTVENSTPARTGRPASVSFSSVSSASPTASTHKSPTPLRHASQKSFTVPKPPSSPRPAVPDTPTPIQRPKSALKSALRLPTPKLQPPSIDYRSETPTPSGSISSKIMTPSSRKMPSPNTARSVPHVPESAKSPSRKSQLLYPHTGRARSRTDPSIDHAVHSHPPATPQPHSTTSNITRATSPRTVRGSLENGHDDTGDSELEYRYEMNARDKRRLVVMNASLAPSSSESEVEARNTEPRTRLPILAERWRTGRKDIVGLGFGFEDTDANRNEVANTHGHSGNTYGEPEQTHDSTAHSTTLRSSIDKLHELRRKRREALLGIVSGLELGSQPTTAGSQNCDDCDSYVVQEGLAISGSGGELAGERVDIEQEQTSDDGSEYLLDDENGGTVACAFEGVERPEKIGREDSSFESPVPTFVFSTEHNRRKRSHNNESRGSPDGLCLSHRHRTEPPLPTQKRKSSGTRSPRIDFQKRGRESITEKTKGRKSPSRSPIVRHSVGVSIPDSLKRYSVYEGDYSPKDATTPPKSHREVVFDAGGDQTMMTHDSDTLSLSETSYAAAARERKAFGIPPSQSDDVFKFCNRDSSMILPQADSDMSSIGSTLFHEDFDELSVGAKALFRTLSGNGDRRSYQQAESDSDRGVRSDENPPLFLDEDSGTRISSSISQSSTSSSVYDCNSFNPTWPKQEKDNGLLPQHAPGNKTWRSSNNLSPSDYETLLEKYGETELERQQIIWELCETEGVFVDHLHTMVRLFILPLRAQNTKIWIAGVPSDVARFFDWLEDIVVLHRQILSTLQTVRAEQSPVVERVADSMRIYVARFEVYQPYIARLEDVTGTIQHLTQEDPESDFGEFVKIQQSSHDLGGWVLESFLAEPMNRLKGYPSYFRKLSNLTPKNHPDFLSTFSLLHSTDMVIRVLSEVKAREDEYDLVKDISAHIHGLPSVQLARRERRLLAHGLLQRVESDDTEKGCSSYFSNAAEPLGFKDSDHSERNDGKRRGSRLLDAINEWNVNRGRSGSIKSTASSATGVSFKSHASTMSSFPVTPSSECFPPFQNPMPGLRPTSKSYARTRYGHTSRQIKRPLVAPAGSVHAFVFTDLVLFATPLTATEAGDEGSSWCLLDDFGLSRVLGITELPKTSTSPPSIVLDLLPVDADSLDTGVIPENSRAKTLCFSIPDDSFANSEGLAKRSDEQVQQEWKAAFERCFQFTLRSLSFPSHSGGLNVDLELDTQQSVLSLLASGLPLPKSPSVQLDEMENNGPVIGDEQLEREERGWWSLRFQQVLREMQRQDCTRYNLVPAVGGPCA